MYEIKIKQKEREKFKNLLLMKMLTQVECIVLNDYIRNVDLINGDNVDLEESIIRTNFKNDIRDYYYKKDLDNKKITISFDFYVEIEEKEEIWKSKDTI